MKDLSELFGYVLIGEALGSIVWLIMYEIHKTPAIGFDGPAGMGLVTAMVAGCIIFSLIGIVDIKRSDDKKR